MRMLGAMKATGMAPLADLFPAAELSATALASQWFAASRWLTLCNALNYNVGNFVKFVTNPLPEGARGRSAWDALMPDARRICDDCRAING
jgi:hypothetical protein